MEAAATAESNVLCQWLAAQRVLSQQDMASAELAAAAVGVTVIAVGETHCDNPSPWKPYCQLSVPKAAWAEVGWSAHCCHLHQEASALAGRLMLLWSSFL